MHTAAVFPGQGAQYVGMGREVAHHSTAARDVFRRASAVLGFDLLALCADGPEDALRTTTNTQPAILVTSLACVAALPVAVDCAAGLSLGEYAALVCAGAIELEDAVTLVRLRGQYMQEACAGRDTMMAAIVGLPAPHVRDVCQRHRALGVVEPSNFNSPGQIVIGGDTPAVRAALATALTLGARRVVPLAVSAPFHTSLMRPAAERLAGDLERARIRDARIPVFANVTASPVQAADDIRRALLAQMASPVLWEQSVRAMHAAGIARFVEFGPGTTLGSMIRRTVTAELCHVGDFRSRDATAAALARSAGTTAPARTSGSGQGG